MSFSSPLIRDRLFRHWENLTEASRDTSDYDPAYNCLAWACDDNTRWWQYDPFGVWPYYWPPDLAGPDANTVVGWVKLFKSLGYEVCDSAVLESGFEKIAIYVQRDATVEHVARQLETGAWSSKLGKMEDIEHPTLEELSGKHYGSVGPIMRRRRP
jgi:hypothetical protein